MGPRVAIAHDWLVRYAGSERCVVEMMREFPEAPLYSTLVNPRNVPPPLDAGRPSLLQHVPGALEHHEWLLPLMPLSWALRREIADVDVMLSSSHACAKGVRIARHVRHVCYCHTPMRYAWDFESEKRRFSPAAQRPARALMSAFKEWDRKSAKGVDIFMANSSAVARRIKHAYERDAQVVFPPVDTDFFHPSGERSDHFLFVGRLVSYKVPDLVVDAFADLPYRLIVVGEGQLGPELQARGLPNVEFRSGLSDEELRDLYRGARALVYPADEDFGIVMAEAQACGTPVIGFRSGGAVDIVADGVTGRLIGSQEVGELRGAIRWVAENPLDGFLIRQHALRFSAARFRRQIRDVVEEAALAPASRDQSHGLRRFRRTGAGPGDGPPRLDRDGDVVPSGEA